MTMTDDERARVLAEIDSGYRELVEVLDSLSVDDLQRPDTVGHWSGKDVLSHITAWDVEGARHMLARDAGQDDSIPEQSQYDTWNEEQVSKTRDWAADQVRTYFERAHRDFVDAVTTSPTVRASFAVGLSGHHYGEHIDQFRAMKSALAP